MILNRRYKTLARSALTAFLACTPAGLSNTVTGSQTLTANVGAIGKLSVVQSSVSLTHTGTTFADFTAAESVQYKVRTTISTGSASLTVRATTDFTPAGGPSVAGGNLLYTCAGASLGTACSGTQTMKTSASTNVITVAAGQCVGSGCAGPNPSSVSINLDLTNNPAFMTGSYSATLTFSISTL
jgi:hypothetical protein